MAYRYTDLIRAAYRGDAAHQHVTAISQHHRIQASPGYRAAAGYVSERLAAAGLDTRVRSYPADGRVRFWSTPSFLEWSCGSATLSALDPTGRPGPSLCDFEAIPTSVIQRSVAVDGDFEVVALGGSGGKAAADYAGIDVQGKLILTDQPVQQVRQLATGQFGSAGILFDGMAAGGRTAFDLPDARQYTSFWWPGGSRPDTWGFVLSPAQGRQLRGRLSKGETVRLRAHIDARFYEGTLEVVDAFIPGEMREEVLLVSHLCHPKPGAHDNASGAAALLETAVTLQRLISAGELPRPRRGIRFVWPPEMTGTYAYLQERAGEEGGLAPIIAGLNLDMVGADQNQTGGVWELVSLPWAGASWADHLLSALREPFLDGIRHRETPFSAGSDHYILSDPTVGIPAPMIIHWPDKYYHTSADTPDRVSPESLARSGALAAVYAYWAATAGEQEARWLAHRMVSRFAAEAAADASAVVEAVRSASGDEERSSSYRVFCRRLDLKAATAGQALGSLARLAPEMAERQAGTEATIREAADRERAWAASETGCQDGTGLSPAGEWRAEAEQWIPARTLPGPIDAHQALLADHPELLPAYAALVDGAGHGFYDDAAVLQYWCDGRRSVAEVADLTELETGRAYGDVPLQYFRLLAESGLIRLGRA